MDYDRRGDGVPTNRLGDFNVTSRALETQENVLCRAGFAESFDQSYSLRLAVFMFGVPRLRGVS